MTMQANDAVGRLKRFVQMWDGKPLSNMGDEVYAIHVGTEWEGSVYISDIRALLAAIGAKDARIKALEDALSVFAGVTDRASAVDWIARVVVEGAHNIARAEIAAMPETAAFTADNARLRDAVQYAFDNGFRWPERFGINRAVLKAAETSAFDTRDSRAPAPTSGPTKS